MGTSKRKLNEKIKQLIQNNSSKDIKESVPIATSEIITEKELDKVFKEDSFRLFVVAGINGINRVRAGEFGEIDFEEIKINEVTLQEIIQRILDIVEETVDTDFADVMLRAFKLALTATLKEDKAILEFVLDFCFYLIFLLVQGELIEAFSDVYTDFGHDQINDLIKQQVRLIVSEELNDLITDYVDGKVQLKVLLKQITSKANAVKIGEF